MALPIGKLYSSEGQI